MYLWIMEKLCVGVKMKVEMFTSMDYDRADDFVRLGIEAAEQQLPTIKNLIKN